MTFVAGFVVGVPLGVFAVVVVLAALEWTMRFRQGER